MPAAILFAEHGERGLSNDLQALTMLAGADCVSAAAVAGASVPCAAANGFVLSRAQPDLVRFIGFATPEHERRFSNDLQGNPAIIPFILGSHSYK